MAAAVPLSLAILSACSWRLFFCARDSRLEAALLTSVFTISVWGICGALCLIVGAFTPLYCAGAVAAAAVAVLGLRARIGPPRPSPARRETSPLALATCGALLLVGVGLRSPPMDAALAGRDQGTYMLRAAAAARDGALSRTNPALAAASRSLNDRPGPADIVGLYPVDDLLHREGVYEGAYRPGFYLADRSTGTVVPQFLHLFPALLGMTRWWLPAALTPCLNLFISALWLLMSFRVGLRFFQRELPALAWVATLALDPLAIWVGRNPLTEPLDALLWMTALLCLLRETTDGDRAPLAAAFFLGVAAWLRGNIWLLAPIMLVPLLLPTRVPSDTEQSERDAEHEVTDKPRPRGDGWLAPLALWWLLAVTSLIVHAMTSFPYLHDELQRLSLATSLTPAKIVWGAGGATLAVAGAATLRHALSSRAGPGVRRVAGLHGVLFVGSACILLGVIVARKIWLASATSAGLARLDLLWPAATAPVLLVAFAGGAWLVTSRDGAPPALGELRKQPMFSAMVLALLGQASLYALPTLPQTGLFYYGRYLLPQLLPLAYGLCVAGLFAVGRRITRARARRAWEGITCVVLVGWVAGPLILSPTQRIQEYAASRSLVESIAGQLPAGSVVIAGGEGWLRAHTFNQVAGALEMEHDVTVLPYRTREAAFATAMELLAGQPSFESSPPPPVFLLLNESTKDRPGGPDTRRAVVDLDLPAPLRTEPLATYELFGHRLKRSAQERPTQALRNEIRLVLASVTPPSTAGSRTFSIANAPSMTSDDPHGQALRCVRDERGWTVSLPPMKQGPRWLSLHVPPDQRDRVSRWRVLVDSQAFDAAILGEKRAERSTLGPWLLRAPPRTVTIIGATASTCDRALVSVSVSSLAPPPARPPLEGAVPHHRVTPPLAERGGYGQTQWTYGHIFNRFRLGASASHELAGDSIWLSSDRPLIFPPSALGSGSYEVSLTLKGLDALDGDAANGRILVEIDGADPLELTLDTLPSARVWTPVVGTVQLDAGAVGLSVTLAHPHHRSRILLRDVALIPTSGGEEADPSNMR